MKRCSTCQRTYADDSQKFCANDGTPLVSDEPAAFDPEATVMSLSSQMEEEPPAPPPPPPPTSPQPPNSYYNPSPQPDQNAHQSYPPPPSPQGSAPSPAWPPQPPPQQPYYPQPGSQPAPQWQGAGQPPPWMPPGQSPQGQNWGPGGGGAAGAYYPQQPGQYAPQAAGGRGLGVAALIVGLISFVPFSLVFGMFMRIVPGDRTVAEVSVYATLLAGIFGVIIGIIALVSSQRRSKMLGIVGLLISIPGILFFLYIASRYGLR